MFQIYLAPLQWNLSVAHPVLWKKQSQKVYHLQNKLIQFMELYAADEDDGVDMKE